MDSDPLGNLDAVARSLVAPGKRILAVNERLGEYAKMGAQFAKWRAVFAISRDRPMRTCPVANAEALARYAAPGQESTFLSLRDP